MTCTHPEMECAVDCSCPCDYCAEEERRAAADAIEMHRRTRLDYQEAV